MSEIKTKIIEDLKQNPGNWTSAEIASRINCSTMSVASTLCWLRGDGLVDDGSSYVKHYDANGNLVGIASSSSKRPIRWSLIK